MRTFTRFAVCSLAVLFMAGCGSNPSGPDNPVPTPTPKPKKERLMGGGPFSSEIRAGWEVNVYTAGEMLVEIYYTPIGCEDPNIVIYLYRSIQDVTCGRNDCYGWLEKTDGSSPFTAGQRYSFLTYKIDIPKIYFIYFQNFGPCGASGYVQAWITPDP